MYNDILSKAINNFAEEYDKKCFEILESYFGKLPRDKEKLIEWFEEKKQQGYLITISEDLKDIFKFKDKEYFVTVKYNNELVLKEIITLITLNFIFEE